MNQINPETIPVLVFCDDTTRDIRVAGLSLLDRLVVAAHRAGCGPITVVCQGPVPPMKRASTLGIPVRVEPAGSRIDGRALLATTHFLFWIAVLVMQARGSYVEQRA
jgi:hypothetical protein